MDESTNGNGIKAGKLAQLLPGSDQASTEREEIIPLLTPDGDDIGVAAVFSYLDGLTKTKYDRIIQRLGKRGRPNYDEGSYLIFDQKCKRIDGLSEADCGMDPKVYFRSTPDGHILLHAAVNEYLARQLPSAGDTKSR